MAQTEDKFRKQLEVMKLKLDEIVEILVSGNTEDISGTYEQIGKLIKRLEKSKDTTADYLMETDKDLEYIKQWTMDHKEDISPFRKVRDQIKAKMEEIAHKETELKLEKQLYIQHKVNEEQTKLKLHQQKELRRLFFFKTKEKKSGTEKSWNSKRKLQKVSYNVWKKRKPGKTQLRRNQGNYRNTQ